ncbi:DUF2958 domain-containing protein [candidate division KSB1 bacterium]|nr:DUF2958 domain-containing protein [candidate division KSB1 bacterium]
MWNTPNPEKLAKIPRLYDTENVPLEEKIIHLHFFIGACDWYIAEFDGEDTFFGYANLGDPDMAEWGNISFSELKSLNVNGIEVDFDLYWEPKRFGDIK